MVPPNYVDSLVKYAESKGEPLGSQMLSDFQDRLWERMQAGEGKELVNSNVNGRAYGWQVNMSVEEQFGALTQALSTLRNSAGDSPFTFIDFSRM